MSFGRQVSSKLNSVSAWTPKAQPSRSWTIGRKRMRGLRVCAGAGSRGTILRWGTRTSAMDLSVPVVFSACNVINTSG